jgi:hypothetical protein
VIATVPMPGWGELLLMPWLARPSGNALAEPWLRDGDLGGVWLSRTAWSLAAIADAFAANTGRRPRVLVPSYICNQSLWPLRQRAELVFHPVDEDTLAPLWGAMAGIQADILLLVHYFGFPADARQARAWAGARGMLLVEDAAHVLRPIAGIGEYGDLVAYSPHKLLAVPDGAVLVARPSAAGLEAALVQAVRALGWAFPSATPWRGKRLIQKSPLGKLLARLRQGGQGDFLSDPQAHALPTTPVPSVAGLALIARADLEEVARRRAANAAALAMSVVQLADWKPLFRLGNEVAPYRLVMRCGSEAEAVRLYAKLRAARLPVESWPDLPPEVDDPAALALRRTCLLLPCHQSLAPQALSDAYMAALS